MPQRPPRSRALPAAALLVAFAGCILLLTACAPRTGASDRAPVGTAVGAGVGAAGGAIGESDHAVAVVASVVTAATPSQDAHLSTACIAPTGRPIPDRLDVHGLERHVLSHAPDGPASQPRDLVIAFHGRTNDAAQARRYFRLDGALPEAVIAYPQALQAGPGTFAWADQGDPPDALRDFDLVNAIIDAFGETTCIDLERVFVVGHSLGAYFANDVGCSLGDRVRAVASVAGGMQGGGCIGGTAALLIHHPADTLVPMSAGEHGRDAFLAANGLADATATPAAHPALATLGCVRYGDADTADPVVWCAHDDATWPSGRYDPHTWPAATPAAIAAFFGHLP